MLNSPYPFYLYKFNCHAGIASNECADAIAKHQAIQGDDTPADTTFPCVNLEGNPFHHGGVMKTPPGLPLRKLPAPMQAH
eukprot:1152493-Pelagomonas_calceolata.AAC.4